MQVFKRCLIETHAVGAEWPDFCGTVSQGESFVIETIECGANGPIQVTGIEKGDVICITVEDIVIEPPFKAPQSGPFILGCGKPLTLEYRDGFFFWPKHFKIRAV